MMKLCPLIKSDCRGKKCQWWEDFNKPAKDGKTGWCSVNVIAISMAMMTEVDDDTEFSMLPFND